MGALTGIACSRTRSPALAGSRASTSRIGARAARRPWQVAVNAPASAANSGQPPADRAQVAATTSSCRARLSASAARALATGGESMNGTPAFSRIDTAIRRLVIDEIAASDLPGLVFTFVWAFNLPEEQEYVDECARPFRERGARVLFVELEATQAAREAESVVTAVRADAPADDRGDRGRVGWKLRPSRQLCRVCGHVSRPVGAGMGAILPHRRSREPRQPGRSGAGSGRPEVADRAVSWRRRGITPGPKPNSATC
jgi:hypothetical protein